MLDLDLSLLYESKNHKKYLESERANDYTLYQWRSFAFATAQKLANDRLYRLDEFKAVVDQISSEEGFKRYAKLREEIVGSHAIELSPEEVRKVSKKDKQEHNKKAAEGLMNMVRG